MTQLKIPLSVVVIVKNEARDIGACLSSVSGWAGEIIIADDFSTDKTVEFARKYTDKIYQRKMDKYGTQANWAYAKAENEWILSLDGHEIVTEELKEDISKILSEGTPHNFFSISIKSYIGNYWVKYGGWYPAPKVRLFRKDKFRYEDVEVHPRIIAEGTCGRLKKDIIHKGYKDFAQLFNSINNQTTLEAMKWLRVSELDPKRARYKMSFFHALWRTVDRFIRSFVVKKGYRDGFIGFMVAIFNSLYQILSYAKYLEMKKKI